MYHIVLKMWAHSRGAALGQAAMAVFHSNPSDAQCDADARTFSPPQSRHRPRRRRPARRRHVAYFNYVILAPAVGFPALGGL